jgi:putative transposase
MAFSSFTSELNLDMKVRRLVASWVPPGSVTTFCRQQKVSRAWFYKIRAAASAQRPMKGTEMRSTNTGPAGQVTPRMVELVLDTRETLKTSGHDCGPTSVVARLRRQGLQPLSRAILARIFTRARVVVPQPRKKLRAGNQGFVYPELDACWQIDSAEWLWPATRESRSSNA